VYVGGGSVSAFNGYIGGNACGWSSRLTLSVSIVNQMHCTGRQRTVLAIPLSLCAGNYASYRYHYSLNCSLAMPRYNYALNAAYYFSFV